MMEYWVELAWSLVGSDGAGGGGGGRGGDVCGEGVGG